MCEVQPVKDIEQISLIAHLLKMRYSQQMASIWRLGINLGLRISDLLSIKFSDVASDRIILRESKTNKKANIILNRKAQKVIEELRNAHPTHVYLFQSYRSRGTINQAPKPLTRRAVLNALSEVGEELNLKLGTHSMRKTRGYHLYKATKDLARVMKMLRHSCQSHTLRYIGVAQEQVDEDFMSLEL
jgi:integrase